MTFCATVFHGSSWSNSWKTTMRSGLGPVTGLPRVRMVPAVGRWNPATILRIDDLPQPDAPISTSRSP